MGIVYLRELRLRTLIGVEPRERSAPQDVLATFQLEADLEPAAATDDLALAVDYAALAALAMEHAARARFQLLEALAGSLASLVLDRFPAVRAVTVRLEKPLAVPDARAVGVELQRRRETAEARKRGSGTQKANRGPARRRPGKS